MKEVNKDENKERGKGRSPISSIPLPTIEQVYCNALQKNDNEKKIEEENKSENEVLRNEMCNAYKFLVNYAYFEPNFEWLPMELLIHIFQYLNTRDLQTAGLVCKRWFDTTQYFRLCKKILVHFQIFKYSDTAQPMNYFLSCTRYFPNIKFTIVKFTPKNDAFWDLHGDMIEELSFNSCIIYKPEFLRILKSCPRLNYLCISRCDDLYKSWNIMKKSNGTKMIFSKVNTLKIHETSLLTKPIFNFMITSMPNLTSLNLENCFGSMKARERTEILDSIIEYIERQAKQIKTLNLLNTQTDLIFLEKLAETENLKLDELRLTFNGNIPTIGKCGILLLIKAQNNLKIFDLTDSKGLSNLCLMEICKNISTLRKLILTRCWLINDVGLREVRKLQFLEVLDISSCDRVTDLGLLEGLIPQGKKFFKLKELYLGLLPYMSILAVYRLSQQYDELQVLDLSGSSNSINDEAIQMIFRYQWKLKRLNLDCCAKITDFGITGYSEHSELGNCKNYVPYNLNNLKDLRYLNISGCYQITDKSLLKCFDLPDLKELNISRCHNCTEVGIQSLIKKCPFIEQLDMSECSRHVTDSTIEIVTKYLTRLEILKLNGCDQITDESLESIKFNCKYLKSLFIRRCRFIINNNPFEVLKNVKYIYN
ncbi:hypothetical protein PVAND_014277 [Polypedilum vanderplanki]|uniref:F-box domain-containing protein n=1 Tax=Polypedilum vanderplanki TaxID=319348 RepID=A0A9J6CT08_POLVA|nr:hypothetical protein PVAND_014277 [Polypedilum vanderplanki]